MKKLLSLVLALAMSIGVCSMFTACGDNTKPLIALIALHDTNSTYDKNFIEAFEAACEENGLSKNDYLLYTNVPEETDCKEKALDAADRGCEVVFSDSFGHEPYMLEAAKEATGTHFASATGNKAHTSNLSNFHNAFASIYEGRYLAGVAAGLKLQEMIDAKTVTADTDGNYKLGYVGAYTYAEVISGYTSWFLGVQSIVPNVKMDVKFTGSWYDETKEGDAARALINGGCVLLSQHADSMGAPNACELALVPNVSYNGSTASACPNTFIISSRINWQPYFNYLIKAAKDLREGKEATIAADWMGTIDNNAVVLTECGQAAAKGTQAKLDEVKAKLLSGEIKVFDTSKFTVTVDTENGKNVHATVDENKHLTSYIADVDFDADYTYDTEVVENGEFKESSKRSAPYFDVQIDGITLLNVKF